MFTYQYKCKCGNVFLAKRTIEAMYACPCDKCGRLAKKDFAGSMTQNIVVPDAFHENQSDILPTEKHELEAWMEHAYRK